MRLDLLLFRLRFARSRTAAQRWIAEGLIRRNGARVLRQDQPIASGDVLTLPLARRVVVVEVLALPSRRGPAAEAQACYRQLDGGGTIGLAGGETQRAEGKAQP